MADFLKDSELSARGYTSTRNSRTELLTRPDGNTRLVNHALSNKVFSLFLRDEDAPIGMEIMYKGQLVLRVDGPNDWEQFTVEGATVSDYGTSGTPATQIVRINYN